MQLLYNGNTISDEELRLPLSNRAFQYNDGFFETIIIDNGHLRYWNSHLERMKEASEALRIDLPSYFFTDAYKSNLLQLAFTNNALNYGRLKLKVWRAGKGLYTPQTNEVEWLATIDATPPKLLKPLGIGVCQSITTVFSPLSHFKGPNALIYVLASQEKQLNNHNDMLLLSQAGHIAELTSSNIFWVNSNVVYTPALRTGCINGIMRRNIIGYCKANSIVVKEVVSDIEHLEQAETVFAANVTGIRQIQSINSRKLQAASSLLFKLQDVFNPEINLNYL